jgi:hypothetical protein
MVSRNVCHTRILTKVTDKCPIKHKYIYHIYAVQHDAYVWSECPNCDRKVSRESPERGKKVRRGVEAREKSLAGVWVSVVVIMNTNAYGEA